MTASVQGVMVLHLWQIIGDHRMRGIFSFFSSSHTPPTNASRLVLSCWVSLSASRTEYSIMQACDLNLSGSDLPLTSELEPSDGSFLTAETDRKEASNRLWYPIVFRTRGQLTFDVIRDKLRKQLTRSVCPTFQGLCYFLSALIICNLSGCRVFSYSAAVDDTVILALSTTLLSVECVSVTATTLGKTDDE